MEDRLHRRPRETVHFEMVRHSDMEGVQGGVLAPLRSSADRGPLTLDDLNWVRVVRRSVSVALLGAGDCLKGERTESLIRFKLGPPPCEPRFVLRT